jgi:hypothetical protein
VGLTPQNQRYVQGLDVQGLAFESQRDAEELIAELSAFLDEAQPAGR